VLGDEGLQHLGLHRRQLGVLALGRQRLRVLDLAGKCAVAQVAAAAHHGQVDGAAALHLDGQDVHVGVAAHLHRLLVQHARQRLDLVAHQRRLLEAARPSAPSCAAPAPQPCVCPRRNARRAHVAA
jgi:hypothetical protein